MVAEVMETQDEPRSRRPRAKQGNERLGRLVNRYRIGAGLTQKELAEAAGTSRSEIGSIEQGDVKQVPLQLLQRIQRVLGIPEDEMQGTVGFGVIFAAVSEEQEMFAAEVDAMADRIAALLPWLARGSVRRQRQSGDDPLKPILDEANGPLRS